MGALVDAPEPRAKFGEFACPDCKKYCDGPAGLAALKLLINSEIPAGSYRGRALERIATLEDPPSLQDDASVKAWADLAVISSHSAKSYPGRIGKALEQIGCAADGAPYVISGLIQQLDDRFQDSPTQEAAVATAFLDEAKCPGARGLSEGDKATLRKIRDRASAPPGSGAAAR